MASARTEWFERERLGMFIHFGLSSIPAGVWKGEKMGRNWYAEWIQMQGNWPKGIPAVEYQALAKVFNPTKMNCDEWVREAKNAGMGWVCITSKHHDGFALWPSKCSKFNVKDATPFGRDILGELANACAKHGLKFCTYYSHWLDWEHPYGGRPHAAEFHSEPRWPQPTQEQFERYWQEKCLPQVRELIDGYRPALMWFDTWAANSSEWITEKRIDELVGLVRAKSPETIINSRIGTWGHSKGTSVVDLISMMDNEFPEKGFEQAWETSGTMHRSWAYHQLDFGWSTAKQLLGWLIGNASRGGNYQLNIGPMGDGSLPGPVVRRLREIGAWMHVNGESVKGTQAGGLPTQSWGFVTKRAVEGGTRYYMHLMEYTPGKAVTVAGLRGVGPTARVLETGQPVAVTGSPEGLVLQVPEEVVETLVPVVVVGVKG